MRLQRVLFILLAISFDLCLVHACEQFTHSIRLDKLESVNLFVPGDVVFVEDESALDYEVSVTYFAEDQEELSLIASCPVDNVLTIEKNIQPRSECAYIQKDILLSNAPRTAVFVAIPLLCCLSLWMVSGNGGGSTRHFTTIPVVLAVIALCIISPSILSITDAYSVPDCPSSFGNPIQPLSSCVKAVVTVKTSFKLWVDVRINKAEKTYRWSDTFSNIQDYDCSATIPENSRVIFDASNPVGFKELKVRGVLEFSSSQNVELSVGTLNVTSTGGLIIRPNSANNHVLSFMGDLDQSDDRTLLKLGLVGYGNVDIKGSHAPVHWQKITEISKAGSTTLRVKQPLLMGEWKRGDWLWMQNKGMIDLVQVESVMGRQVTIQTPLSHDQDEYIAHLSRNVIMRNVFQHRGRNFSGKAHVFFNGPNANVAVRNTMIWDLGRTSVLPAEQTNATTGLVVNPKGRYSLHAHFASRHKFHFIGNAVYINTTDRDHASRWGIVNHQSFGDIVDNVVVGATGAGIITEDGFEFGTISYNFVYGAGGGSHLMLNQRAFPDNDGHCGAAYWISSVFTSYINNMAVGLFDCEVYNGAFHIRPVDPIQTLYFPGSSSKYNNVSIALRPLGILEGFIGNVADAYLEIYSVPFPAVLRIWGGTGRNAWGDGFFDVYNFTSLNGHQIVGHLGYSGSLRFSNSTFISPDVVKGNEDGKTTFCPWFNDGFSLIMLDNCTVKGFDVGVVLSARRERFEIRNSHLDNHVNIWVELMGFHRFATRWRNHFLVKDTTFGDGTLVQMDNIWYDTLYAWLVWGEQNPLLSVEDRLMLKYTIVLHMFKNNRQLDFFNFNKTGENFTVVAPQQLEDFVIPTALMGISQQNLTGSQLHQQFGRAINDRMVTRNDARTHPKVDNAYLTTITDRLFYDRWVGIYCTPQYSQHDCFVQYIPNCQWDSECYAYELEDGTCMNPEIWWDPRQTCYFYTESVWQHSQTQTRPAIISYPIQANMTGRGNELFTYFALNWSGQGNRAWEYMVTDGMMPPNYWISSPDGSPVYY